MNITKKLITATAACLVLGSAMAQANDYPQKPIRLLIPAAPGGGVDTVGRVLANRLSMTLGKPVVPENRPGAGTMLASQELTTTPPDGYTLLMITSSHSINAAVRKNVRYDAIKDFTPISLVAAAPDLLVVNASSPIRSVQELIAAAKKNPGKLSFGSAGTGSGSHMDAELLKSMANIDMLHVPYRGGVPAVTALLGNETDMMFLGAVGLVSHIKGGKLRPLAVTGKTRIALLPNVPTMAEAGLPAYSADVWYGMVAPARTPKAIVTTLNKAIHEALGTADVKDKLIAAGLEVEGSTPEAFTTTMAEDIARWKKVVEKAPHLVIEE